MSKSKFQLEIILFQSKYNSCIFFFILKEFLFIHHWKIIFNGKYLTHDRRHIKTKLVIIYYTLYGIVYFEVYIIFFFKTASEAGAKMPPLALS